MTVPRPRITSRCILAVCLAAVLSPAGAAFASPPNATAPRPGGHTAARSSPDLSRDTLAVVGPRAITAEDLVKRIEWMPFDGAGGPGGMDSTKVRALQSLVGEALLSQEAHRQGLGEGGRIARMIASLRRALARDALYREVTRGVTAPAAEVERIVSARAPRARPPARATLRKAVSDSLAALARRDRAARFMEGALRGQRVEVDSATFMLLADSLRALMAERRAGDGAGRGHPLDPGDVDVLLSLLAPHLERPIARLPDGPLTLGDALEDLRYYSFFIRSLAPRRFAVELSMKFREVVEAELMAREALRRHLDARPEVRADLEMWSGAWRGRLLLERVAAGAAATEDEALRRMAVFEPQRARQACEVDVEEVLSATEADAGRVRAELDSGARFDSLARARTSRAEWRGSGGRSGFFRVALRPGLGTAALLAPLDSLRGPVRLPEGSSVFRVLGKRLTPDSAATRTAVERHMDAITAARRSEWVARRTAEIAADTPPAIRYERLPSLEILDTRMVTRRTLGFGGGMLAAPGLPPLWEWVRMWRPGRPALP
ncbi:MAG: hypothetical protein HZB25_06410 [Candidatus Eisenbacteria bacterium]|nr:hypothetical protein [Candidatus Eisenbacteria bacterium]